jgi:hypothetical protein
VRCFHRPSSGTILLSEPVQSLVLKRGLSLARTDCVPCGRYRSGVEAPGLPLRTSFMAASAPVRSISSTYRIPFGFRHGSSLLNPLRQPTHEIPEPPFGFLSPSGRRGVFPPNASLGIIELDRSTAQISSPWYAARSPFAPRWRFLNLGMPSDHRSGSATVYQACCSIKPLGTFTIVRLLHSCVKGKMLFSTDLNYVRLLILASFSMRKICA